MFASSTHLTTCELASSGMAGLMKENCDELERIKHRRSPQLHSKQNTEMPQHVPSFHRTKIQE